MSRIEQLGDINVNGIEVHTVAQVKPYGSTFKIEPRPSGAGVYVFLAARDDRTGDDVYVGQTDDLDERMCQYEEGSWSEDINVHAVWVKRCLNERTPVRLGLAFANRINGAAYIPERELHRLLLEQAVILYYQDSCYEVSNLEVADDIFPAHFDDDDED